MPTSYVVYAAVCLAGCLFATGQALAQTDETCITYMEAAASYNEVVFKHNKLVSSAYRKAEKRYEKAFYAKVKNPMEPDEDPTYRQLKNAGKEAVNQAKATFHSTLLNAYRGPRSSVNSVLWSLINEDLKRCADDGFPMPTLAYYGW